MAHFQHVELIMKSFDQWFNQTGRELDTRIKSPSDDDFAEDDELPEGLTTSMDATTGYVRIMAVCRSCENDYEIFCSPADFDPEMSYCGGSPSCCP